MKTTLSWLKSHLDTEAPAAAPPAPIAPDSAPRTGEGMSSGRNP